MNPTVNARVINSVGAGIIWGSMFADYDMAGALKAIHFAVFLALGRYDYFNPPHLWEGCRGHASDFTVRIFEKSGYTPNSKSQTILMRS